MDNPDLLSTESERIRRSRLVTFEELHEQRERIRSISGRSGGRRRSSSIRRHNANIRSLWACGVGAVISGDYFGWNSALTAGYGGTLLFLTLVITFYTLLTNAVAEMVTRIPEVGGAYTFAVVGCGRFWGFLVGVAETVKMISITGAIVCSISDYAVSSDFWLYHFLVWVAFLTPLVILNSLGVTFSFQMAITLASVFLLVGFYVGSFFVADFTEYAIGDGWFVDGFDGVLEGLPFILWFFVGIEELPLTVEEVADPLYDMPRAISAAMATLAVLALLTVTLSCSVSPGTVGFISVNAPLLAGYEAVFGSTGLIIDVLSVLTITGLVCSLHSFIYFSGQIVYSMALDSLYPQMFAQTSINYDTPIFALVLMSLSSLALLTVMILYFGVDGLISVLLALGIFVSVFSYIVQFFAFIQLRNSSDQPKKFYSSPFGKTGACFGIIFGILTLMCLIYLSSTNTEYAAALIFGSVVLAGSLIYYRIKLWPKLKKKAANGAENLIETGSSAPTTT